ncbi:FAD/NAD(P)-binding protein [Streptomyces sp. NPDC026206]|uniref:FAD/NAD(P)-binding protein n=1 Tax=Streptomyces sp. NPDC026206 TaxID=3157089 RepID=UPI0033CB1D91
MAPRNPEKPTAPGQLAGHHGRDGRDVVIVGAGVAGTSVFVHLIRALSPDGGPPPVRSVRLVDPRPAGWGLAFGDGDPLLLCNSAAEINSLLADDHADFVNHLRKHGRQGGPQDCVPRARVAEYCREHYTQAHAVATALGIDVRQVPATAETVGTRPDGRHRVRLSTGAELDADAVVVCTGVHRPRVPDGFAGLTDHPRYLDSPYPADRLRRELRPRSRVLVLGTRQSAIDAALLLCRDGHRAVMTSPSGRLPSVRTSLGAPVRDFPPVERITRLDPADPFLEEKVLRCAVEAVRLLSRRPLRRQTSVAADPVQRLREETALVDAGACFWPGVVVALIEAVIALGAGLPAPRRQALMEHFAWFTGRYATAMTVVNARKLLVHFATGALRPAHPYPAAVTFGDDAWRVRWPRAAGAPERFDHVVNGTGFHQPVLHWSRDGRTLHLDGPGDGATAVDHLEDDLRVRRRPGAPPERIWVAGVGTHVRIPFSNHLRNVVRQARRVAEEVAGRRPEGTGGV